MKQVILSLKEALDIRLSGGKASSLAKLLGNGFNVPGGFVITTEADDLTSEIMQREIDIQLESLGSEFMAVRSSAISEDGDKTSWAGQLETFLNVRRKDVLDAVQKCRDSGHSQRAKSYARQNNISTSTVAVLVQEMVQSEVSGVAFSAHPVTNNTQEIVIEAVLGLGEALVSGSVTPDTYIINKGSSEVTEIHLGNQAKKLIQNSHGENEWLEISNGNFQKLNKVDLAELAKLIIDLEMYYGFPVDVEWAKYNGKLFVLQSRPITTLG